MTAAPGRSRLASSLGALLLGLIVLLAGHHDLAMAAPSWAIAAPPEAGPSFEVAVVEHLRLKVPADGRQAWLDAEQQSWEPWLAQQDGFLGRQLLWDAEREEGTLLIRWASKEQWKAIAAPDVAAVQQRFEQVARDATGQSQGNPFPLIFEGELLPQ